MMTTDPRQQPNGGRPLTEAQFLAEAPLLINLKKRMEGATSLKEWAIARVQWALYLARTSRIDEAARVPADIRQKFRGIEDPEVFVWLWILDGVLVYYRAALTEGRTYISRALALSKRLGREDLFQYASAWMSHLYYIDGDYRNSVKWLINSRLDSAVIPEAACRASLIAALSWQICGDNSSASKWFARAREIARTLGDRASIMASLENRAMARLDRIWIETCDHAPASDTLDQVETELRSSLSYERVTGTDSLVDQGPIARLRIFVLRRDFPRALAALEELSADAGSSNLSMVRATPIVELWIRVEMGLVDRVDVATLKKLQADIAGVDDDDAAVCLRYLCQLATRFGYSDVAEEFNNLSQLALKQFNAQIDVLKVELARFPEWAVPGHVEARPV